MRATTSVGTSSTSAARRAAVSVRTNWSVGTSTLPPRWPHFFSLASWSSKCTPAAPASIIALISSKAFRAPPNPASASATIGTIERVSRALAPRDLVGALQRVVDAPHDGRHRVRRVQGLVGVGVPGEVRVGGDLPAAQVDRLQAGLHHLDGLSAGQRAERGHVVRLVHQLPQALGAQARDRLLDQERARAAGSRPRRSSGVPRRSSAGRSPTRCSSASASPCDPFLDRVAHRATPLPPPPSPETKGPPVRREVPWHARGRGSRPRRRYVLGYVVECRFKHLLGLWHMPGGQPRCCQWRLRKPDRRATPIRRRSSVGSVARDDDPAVGLQHDVPGRVAASVEVHDHARRPSRSSDRTRRWASAGRRRTGRCPCDGCGRPPRCVRSAAPPSLRRTRSRSRSAGCGCRGRRSCRRACRSGRSAAPPNRPCRWFATCPTTISFPSGCSVTPSAASAPRATSVVFTPSLAEGAVEPPARQERARSRCAASGRPRPSRRRRSCPVPRSRGR